MKKIKLMKTVLLLCAVFVFSNCEEDGPIQFAVVDEFETNATVTGLKGAQQVDIDKSMDVSDLLDNGSKFVSADVESVIITLKDYDGGGTITGGFDLKIGGKPLFNQSLTLKSGVPSSAITIPSGSSDILSSITGGNVQVKLNGSTASPISDNSFTLNLKFKIKAVVE